MDKGRKRLRECILLYRPKFGGRISFMEGRPKRLLPINSSDITDLKITLNTAKNLDELLARM